MTAASKRWPVMAEARTAVDWLASERITRIVALLLIMALPHMLWMPIWATAIFLMSAAWRVFMARRGTTLRPAWLRTLMTLAAVAAIWLHFGGLNGQQPGVALLVVMSGMKLLETRTQRDCRLLVYLALLMLLGQLLYSQEMQWALWLIGGGILTLIVLIDLQHPQAVLPLRNNARTAFGISLKALPLALLFFLLFPRIPGPLWGIPNDSSAGRTGLSDSMEPGSLSSLAQSDEVAFRVRFQGEAPPSRELYWRGPVFVKFDGLSWEAQEPLPGLTYSVLPESTGTAGDTGRVAYEIQLVPHGRKYIPALDLVTNPLPSGVSMGVDYTLGTRSPVVDARLLPMQSDLSALIGPTADHWRLGRYRALPSDLNPRTRTLAEEWVKSSASTQDLIQTALRYFREESFRYTLNPGLLTSFDRIDQFLFETRAGFCEHFASAFVVLMRSAGLPARVVTGYQGAENNGAYYIVRQSDAHAWAEVWVEGLGWQRVDPTGAVAPDRIEFGLGSALGDSAFLPALARGRDFTGRWLVGLRLQWDRIDAFWNRAILAFGPELQRQFLSRFGMGELRQMLYGLVAAIIIFGLGFALQMLWQSRHRPAEDPLAELRTLLLRKSRLDLPSSAQGPTQIAAALRASGLWNAESERILNHYQRLRYARAHPAAPEQVMALRRAITHWKPTHPR